MPWTTIPTSARGAPEQQGEPLAQDESGDATGRIVVGELAGGHPALVPSRRRRRRPPAGRRRRARARSLGRGGRSAWRAAARPRARLSSRGRVLPSPRATAPPRGSRRRSVSRSSASTIWARSASVSRSVRRRAAASGEPAADRARASSAAHGRAHEHERAPGAKGARRVEDEAHGQEGHGRRARRPLSAARSMRAAPVRSVRSTGSGCVRPSGKIRIAPPARRVAVVAAKRASFFAGSFPASWRRCTGKAPARRRKGATSGMLEEGSVGEGAQAAGNHGQEEHRVHHRVVMVGGHDQGPRGGDALGSHHVDALVEDGRAGRARGGARAHRESESSSARPMSAQRGLESASAMAFSARGAITA